MSLALFPGRIHAQWYLSGMKGVELRGGFANGSKPSLNHYAGFAVSGYTERTGRRVIGTEYLMKDYGYRNVNAPCAQLTAEGGYYLRLLSGPTRTIFLSIDGPALADYETVNWGDRMLYGGSALLVKDAFTCSGAITLGLETYLADRITLPANIRECALWRSSLDPFTTQLGLGVKFIIHQNCTSMTIEEIEAIPIAAFLARIGYEPARRRNDKYRYLVLYREERTASFRVDVRKEIWHGFGTGQGGDTFNLAGEFIGSGNFKAQARFITETWGGLAPEYKTVPRTDGNNGEDLLKERSFMDVRFGPLYNRVLSRYLAECGISSDVAVPNCWGVRYTLHGKRYSVTGFRNVSDGYGLRNRFFKASLSPEDILLMGNGSGACNLFEGFIGCLSWLELDLGYRDDYLVLNSVSLLERSFPILDRYERASCHLDRDEAGRRMLETLRKRYVDKLVDCSSLYKGYKDLDEYLQHKFL